MGLRFPYFYSSVNSLMSRLPLPYFSMTESTYLMSTPMVRWSFSSKRMSPDMASQLPSNARPMRRPFPSNIPEPELPPVMSLLVRKQSCMSFDCLSM